MAVSTVFVGRPPGSTVSDLGVIAEDNLRVCVFNRVSGHMWLKRIGARIGVNSGSNIQYRLVAYRGTPDHVPDQRLALVGLHTINTAMVNAAGGADVEWDVDTVDVGPSNLAAQVYDNIYLALGVEQDTAGVLGHGMIASGLITADEERFFDKTGVDVPPDPFGSYTSSPEGHLAIWAVLHTNDAPQTPINRSALTSTGDLTPTLEADFRDLNGAYGPGNGGFDDGDKLKQVQIQVRRVSDAVIFWDTTYSALGSEQTNNRSSKVYAGTTLVRGTAYEWRIRHSDQFDAWGPYSSWLGYTPPSAGSVTINSSHTPTGKQDAVNGFTFQFNWTHATGLSTNGIKARFKKDGAIVQENGLWKADTTASGATGTITYAELGFGDLEWGGNYTVALKGRDTANVESNWSNEHAFTTDKAPTVPSGLSPQANAIRTSFPKLIASWTDADDTTATGLTGSFEITRPDTSVVTVTPTYNAATGKWEYQTTATELPAYGAYAWRARSFDGTLYSGETTSAGSATWAGPVHFSYLLGPTVTGLTPASNATITTSAPTITWSPSAQAKYQVTIVDSETQQAVLDTGLVTDAAARSYVPPAGRMGNLSVNDITVLVEDGVGLQGSATSTNVLVSYVAPADVVGLTVQPVEVNTDPWPTAIRGEWQQTSEPPGTFLAYLIYRSDIVDRPWQEITSPTETTFLDLLPTSGVEFAYTVQVLALRDGIAEVRSAGVTASTTVDLKGVVLASVTDAITTRAVLTRIVDRQWTRRGVETTYLPWGAITSANSAPTTIRGKSRWWEVEIRALIADDDAAPAPQRRQELEAVEGVTVCYRDEAGRKGFYTIPADNGVTFTDRRFSRADVDLLLRQESFVEGVPERQFTGDA